MSTESESLVLEELEFGVRNGELSEASSWVYVWVKHAPVLEVIYVGATALPPAARLWLHLHHDDPEIGRVRALHPDALSDELTVFAFRLDPGLDRKVVKESVVALLDGVKVPSGKDVRDGQNRKAAVEVVDRIHALLGPASKT